MIVLSLAIVFGAIAIAIALVWDRTPWWRTTPKPSRIYKNARSQVKTWRIMKKYPEAFPQNKVNEER
jgi:hypothetical protein